MGFNRDMLSRQSIVYGVENIVEGLNNESELVLPDWGFTVKTRVNQGVYKPYFGLLHILRYYL